MNKSNSDKNLIEYHQANTTKYTILKKVGKGSFGTVFKAVNNLNQQTVAIKFIDLKKASKALLISVCREISVNQFLADQK
jgi:serine/threonine protein kinase